MYGLYMADVGDGLCMSIDFPNQNCIQIDCGSNNGSNYALEGYQWLTNVEVRPNSFILSHLHKDHYNGLPEVITNNLEHSIIDRVYYPKMPELARKDDFLRAMSCMNAYLLGNETGSMEYDLLEIIRIMNGGFRPYNIPLWEGQHFIEGGYRYEVLWPPFSLNDQRLSKKIDEAISSFNAALESEPELYELNERVKGEGKYRKYGEAEGSREEQEDNIRWALSDRTHTREVSDEVASANSLLKDAANHLSLSFVLNDNFLFLGDLENREIRLVISNLLDRHSRNFDILITAHHGTHDHEILGDVGCNFAFSSVGKGLSNHLKPIYKKISRNHRVTWVNGNLTLFSHPERAR